MRLTLGLMVLAQALMAQSAPEVRAAVARGLPILQRSAAEFVGKRACVSCHHNILPILMFHLARERGVEFDAAVLQAVEEKTFRQLVKPGALDDAIQGATVNDPTPNDSFLLMAAHAAGIPAGLVPAVYARRLVSWQRDGHWVTSDFRPPHSSSTFTATASAIRAIQLYLPEELKAQGDACVWRARQWLVATRPLSTEDAAFRLMGLVWASAPDNAIEAARNNLRTMSKPDGGWAELAGYPSDAYSTGEALYALRQSGVSDSDPAWRGGLKFLISTQARDGSWRVRTRMVSPAPVSPPYFSTGFPYQKDEYLSYAGSCWAVMALLSAMPQASQPFQKPRAISEMAEGWIRTALFGTVDQLAGLDPNQKTKNGTTLLMMAAPDAAKVRVLLARGAEAKARAASGADALTIAASYRGTAASMQMLLDAGAQVKPPPEARVRNTPLLFASMAGDLENVKLLLARGADPSGALSAAVTFGDEEVTRALLAAGASATIREANGINLLHWAAIANRPGVIPMLVRAGASLNAMDENGYTPLMYAATIDFGDSKVIEALLRAGADRTIRNADGRTPSQQARHFRHTQLEAALK